MGWSGLVLGNMWRPGRGKAVTTGRLEDFELTGFPCQEWPERNDFWEKLALRATPICCRPLGFAQSTQEKSLPHEHPICTLYRHRPIRQTP